MMQQQYHYVAYDLQGQLHLHHCRQLETFLSFSDVESALLLLGCKYTHSSVKISKSLFPYTGFIEIYA